MKKLFVLLVAVVVSFGLVACGGNDPLVDAEHNYWASGNFAGWGDAAGDADYQMEAIALNDERVASIKGDLKNAEFLYLKEIVLPTDEAGWGDGSPKYTIDGVEKVFDGNLTVKVLRSAVDDEANVPEFWAQNSESGAISNLTPETFYIPTYAETVDDGSGTWADNPVAMEAGTYYLIFAQFEDGTRAMGLIPVE